MRTVALVAAELVDLLADAARVLARLDERRGPERIPVAQAAQHGAPSARWLADQARAGRITLRGPRGGRYVVASELAALLSSTSIKRRAVPTPSGDLEASARAAVQELARRRRP